MNAKISFFLAMMTASAIACREDPKPAPTPPAPISLPATAPSSSGVEVLIVTQPEEAQILAEGQVLGKTPMKIEIREDTNLVLEKEGFVRQAILLTTKSDPNLVVKLLPTGDEEQSPEPPAEEKSKNRVSKTKHKRAPEDKADNDAPKTTVTEPKQPQAAPPQKESEAKADPKPAAKALKKTAPKKTARQKLDTMRKCKDAHNNGLITRADYQRAVQEIRQRLKKEIDALKTRYRNGEITKAQYRQEAREIKLRYEG